MIRRGDKVIFKLEKLVYKGYAAGHILGQFTLTRGGYPGEVVLATVTRKKKDFLECSVNRILIPSEKRVEPRCQHFGTCGGCSWQDLDYNEQILWKDRIVRESLRRLGGLSLPEETFLPIIPSPKIFEYRNKIELQFAQSPNGETIVGMHPRGRFNSVFKLHECRLVSPKMTEIATVVSNIANELRLPVYNEREQQGLLRYLTIREGTNGFMVNITVFRMEKELLTTLAREVVSNINEVRVVNYILNNTPSSTAYGTESGYLAGDSDLILEILDKRFIVSPQSFFQTNTGGTAVLYRKLSEMLELKGNEFLVDLFSGTGTIGIILSDKVERVVAIENNPDAVKDAKRNAKINGVNNIRFILADARKALSKLIAEREKPDLIVLDPPRDGLSKKIILRIVELAPSKIAYVSCNPTTVARDLKTLSEKYRILSIQPIDMFPHTYHIETITVMEKIMT